MLWFCYTSSLCKRVACIMMCAALIFTCTHTCCMRKERWKRERQVPSSMMRREEKERKGKSNQNHNHNQGMMEEASFKTFKTLNRRREREWRWLWVTLTRLEGRCSVSSCCCSYCWPAVEASCATWEIFLILIYERMKMRLRHRREIDWEIFPLVFWWEEDEERTVLSLKMFFVFPLMLSVCCLIINFHRQEILTRHNPFAAVSTPYSSLCVCCTPLLPFVGPLFRPNLIITSIKQGNLPLLILSFLINSSSCSPFH